MEAGKLTEQEIKDELKIVEAAKEHPEKFSVLYEKYYQNVYLFVFKRTGDEELAGDLTSQVFLKAMLNLKKWEYKGLPFSAWLFRIASNEVNQHYRKHKNQRAVSIQDTDLERILVATESDYPEKEARIRQVLGMIQELEPDEIQIMELRFFEERPYKEIGYILGITENNAKVRVFRILEKVKKKVKKKAERNL